jgi:hypothetical protein
MDTERNELEQALFRLGRNFTRVNNTVVVANKLCNDSELGKSLATHWQSVTDAVASVCPAVDTAHGRSREAAAYTVSDGFQSLCVAALALWHTAIEEYYFELLKVMASRKPCLFKPGSEKKYQVEHVLTHDTRQYKLSESYCKLCKLCDVEPSDSGGIRAHIKSLKHTTELRNGAIHKGEQLPGEMKLEEVIREQNEFATKVAILVGEVTLLDINCANLFK